jgi:hypothetical protein
MLSRRDSMDLTFWGGGEGGPLLSVAAALPDKCSSPTIEVCVCVCECVCVCVCVCLCVCVCVCVCECV